MTRATSRPQQSIFNPFAPIKQGLKSAETALAVDLVVTGPAAVVFAVPVASIGFGYGLLKGYAQQTKAKYGDTFAPSKK